MPEATNFGNGGRPCFQQVLELIVASVPLAGCSQTRGKPKHERRMADFAARAVLFGVRGCGAELRGRTSDVESS